MANNQDIKLRKLEELLAEYQEALGNTNKRSEQIRIHNAILVVEDTIRQEREFRDERDEVLARQVEFSRAQSELERLIEEVQTPPIMYDVDAWNYLQERYNEVMGTDDFPRGKEGGADFEAALAKIKHVEKKLQIEVDAVYGNVDAKEYKGAKSELESIESGLAENKQRTQNYRELKNTLAKLKADPDFATKLAEYKKAESELAKAENDLKDKQQKVDEIKRKIKENEDKIDRLQNELKKLEGIDPSKRTKEQNARIAAIKGEISNLQVENNKLTYGALILAEAACINAKTVAEQKKKDLKNLAAGNEDILRAVGLISELGIQDGDKPYELSDAIDSAIKFVGKAHKAEKLTAQKREMQERAKTILDKYGVEADVKKGKFVETLDKRVEDILKNYNPAHIQPGFDDRDDKEEIDENETETPSSTEPGHGGATSPSGSRSTGAPGAYAPGVGSRNTGGSNVPGTATPPTQGGNGESKDPNQSEPSQGNYYQKTLARGVLVEKIDGEVDYKALLADKNRTKIENGYVYRIADIGPIGDDPDKREYAQVKEPIDWYTQDTTKKLGRALTTLITQLRDLNEAEQKQLWRDLGITSLNTNRLKKAVTKGVFSRAKNHYELMKELEGIDPKAQVEMLVALTTLTEEDPKRAAECLMKMNGNPYPFSSDLVVTTKAIGFFGKEEVEVVKTHKYAEDLIDGYKKKRNGTPRVPTERQSGRDKSKGQKKNPKRNDKEI